MQKLKILPVLLIWLFLGCSKDEARIIDGQVVSQNGDPIEGADIHFVPSITTNLKLKPSTLINYTISEAGNVRLETFAKWRGELIEVLVDAYHSGGSYTAILTEGAYTNRLYEYRISQSRGEDVIVGEFFLAAPAEELIGSNPITTSDQSGRFELDIGELAIGKEFNITSEESSDRIAETRVTNQVEFIAIKEGEIIARVVKEVNEDKNNSVTLTAE